eukprot:TRINITY_DN4483_c0_g1_i43.p1 TRINITY_DN4483_c0_g1~~TRINITY_DN4483_c0_g1_i43.p1  ORF type:complete len:116 (-),score=0.09 TRINITY_DN4483_c0_g1_i43:36-383(-)
MQLIKHKCPVRVVISVQDSTYRIHLRGSECPVRVVISVQDSTFHSFIVLSSDPLARIVPLLLNATEECPVRVVISVQDSTFHSFIVLSEDLQHHYNVLQEQQFTCEDCSTTIECN